MILYDDIKSTQALKRHVCWRGGKWRRRNEPCLSGHVAKRSAHVMRTGTVRNVGLSG